MSKHEYKITLDSESEPVVELDSEAKAAYIRFSKRKVVRTHPVATNGCIVTIDFDSGNEVVGVEVCGVVEVGIKKLIKKAGLSVPESMLEKAKYFLAGPEKATC
jgi:uncharacterized protein YuzE